MVVAFAEVEVVREFAFVERTGPVVAARAVIAEFVPVEVARSGEKDSVAVCLAGYHIATNRLI